MGRFAMRAKLIGAVVAVTTACVITWGGNAHAEILITTATISQGELVIVGRVRGAREPGVEIKISPSKTVQVKGTSTGGFRWIGPEVPSTAAFPDRLDRPDRQVLRGPQGRWAWPDPREIPARPLSNKSEPSSPPVHAGGLWRLVRIENQFSLFDGGHAHGAALSVFRACLRKSRGCPHRSPSQIQWMLMPCIFANAS